MKEQLDMIPVNDAFLSEDECPFCYLERKAEQNTIRYVAGPGASYMEPDVRGATDTAGFCPTHMKKLYDYGNTLGQALILQTYYAGLLEEFQLEKENFKMPPKPGLFQKRPAPDPDAYHRHLEKRLGSCFICQRVEYHMQRYYNTFFAMLKDKEFRSRVENSKGFCMRHFAQLMQQAEEKLPGNQQKWFYPTIFNLMEANLIRVKEDLDWLVAKYDYRNAAAPWGNSRDALPRAIQKLQGLHPADPPYKMD